MPGCGPGARGAATNVRIPRPSTGTSTYSRETTTAASCQLVVCSDAGELRLGGEAAGSGAAAAPGELRLGGEAAGSAEAATPADQATRANCGWVGRRGSSRGCE